MNPKSTKNSKLVNRMPGRRLVPSANRSYSGTRSSLDNVPRWVFGETVHPAPQFVRDFVLHRIGYHRSLRSAVMNAYAVGLARRNNRGKLSQTEYLRRLGRIAKWM